jgi:pimeloyl-ACP methyl ester carboxylesterase
VFDPDPDATRDRGVTLLAVDRPGYGASDPIESGAWSTVAQAADDLGELLRDRVAGPVGVVGWSAGGRVALALAARHAALVTRVAVIATPAPNEHVPWIPAEHQHMIDAVRHEPPDEVHRDLGAVFASMVPGDPAARTALDLLSVTDADDSTALARPGARARLGEMLRAAFAQGAVGLTADVAGYTMRPWGFAPEEVTAKTLLIFGAADPVAGSRHGRWWQRALPDARLEMAPGAGHLVIVPLWGRVLRHLAPTRRGAPAAG